MPTKKFFDLSEEKKEAFVNAAISEFERQTFEEASIFNIAHNAGVSRTGIYYYFTNKQDIYDYLLSLMRDDFFEYVKSSEKLDVFELFMKYFEFIASYKGTRNEKFIRQMHGNMKLLGVNTLSISLQKLKSQIGQNPEIIDLSNLKYDNEDFLKVICLMGFGATSHLCSDYFSGKLTYDDAKQRCGIFMDCLKNGFVG